MRARTKITRLQAWPSKLFTLIEARRHEPFAWGKMDCCLFACDAIEAMTGGDPARDLRGYATREGAEEILNAHGGLEALIIARCADCGFAEIHPRKAQRGDLVLFDNAGNPALGICIAGEVAFSGRDGIVSHPLRDCRRAWRVG